MQLWRKKFRAFAELMAAKSQVSVKLLRSISNYDDVFRVTGSERVFVDLVGFARSIPDL